MTDTQNIGVTDDYYEGDTLEITLTVTKPDGSNKSLSGASVSFVVVDYFGGNTIIDDSDTNVSASITDATNGEITITLDSGATNRLDGDHEYYVRVTDSGGDSDTVTVGDFIISSR